MHHHYEVNAIVAYAFLVYLTWLTVCVLAAWKNTERLKARLHRKNVTIKNLLESKTVTMVEVHFDRHDENEGNES